MEFNQSAIYNVVFDVVNPVWPRVWNFFVVRKPNLLAPGVEDDALDVALGLGDLAGLTVNNEADPLSYDVSKHCTNSGLWIDFSFSIYYSFNHIICWL